MPSAPRQQMQQSRPMDRVPERDRRAPQRPPDVRHRPGPARSPRPDGDGPPKGRSRARRSRWRPFAAAQAPEGQAEG